MIKKSPEFSAPEGYAIFPVDLLPEVRPVVGPPLGVGELEFTVDGFPGALQVADLAEGFSDPSVREEPGYVLSEARQEFCNAARAHASFCSAIRRLDPLSHRLRAYG